MSNNNHIISIRGLYKTFKLGDVDVPALRGVDLDVDHGEFVAVKEGHPAFHRW